MKVSIEKVESYDLKKIEIIIERIFESLGFWQKISNLKTILIKPNLLGPFKPEKAVTTHPIVLEALIGLLKKREKEVWIGDSPGGSTSVQHVYNETGIAELAEKYEVKLVNFSEGGIVQKQVGEIDFPIAKYFWQADAVINVAKLKTHSLMYYTGAVKNMYGVIPGLKKSDYHRLYPDHKDFTRVLTSLHSITYPKITLNILDGIWGMEGEGPSAGVLRKFALLAASNSAAALDYSVSAMLGFTKNQLTYIYNALEIEKLKTEDIEIEKKWQKYRFGNVKIKKVSALIKLITYSPKFLKNIFKRLYIYHPAFSEKCKRCMVCVNSCPVKALTLTKKDKVPQLDVKKCIKCMCCHELCPYSAVYIKKSFLAKILIRS